MSNNNKKKKELLGGPNASISNDLLGGNNATIKSDRELVNIPRDMNNIFKGVGNLLNQGIMGDWYDPDHQTVVYKSLHPKQKEQIDAATSKVQQNRPNATTSVKQNEVAKELTPSFVKPPQPVQNTKAPIQNVQTPTPALKPVATDKETGATINVDPKTGTTVVSDPATNTNTVVSPQVAASPKTPEQTSTPPQQPAYEGKGAMSMDQMNKNQTETIAKNQELYKGLRPIIQKQYGLTDEQMMMLDNNIPLPPQTPWAMQHPVAAMMQSALQGLSMGAYNSARFGGRNAGGNIMMGLGAGFANGANNQMQTREDYQNAYIKSVNDLGNNLETGRMYAGRIPGLGMATGKNIGELETYQQGRRQDIQQENQIRESQNDSVYAQGQNLKPGDLMGSSTQQSLLAKRTEGEKQAIIDDQIAKVATLQQKIIDADGKYNFQKDELNGLTQEQVNYLIGLKDPERLERLKQQKQQTTINGQNIDKNKQSIEQGKRELYSTKPFDPANKNDDAGWQVLTGQMKSLQDQYKATTDPKKKETIRQRIEQLNQVGEFYQSPNARIPNTIEFNAVQKMMNDLNYGYAPKSAAKANPLSL